MAEMRTIFNEWRADMTSKGCGGLVSQIVHDYKNGASILQHQPPYTTYTDLKTKNGRNPAALFLLDGGVSLPNKEDYIDNIYSILNKSPGLTATQLIKEYQKKFPRESISKHKIRESLQQLKQSKIIDYDQYFKFYPCQVVS